MSSSRVLFAAIAAGGLVIVGIALAPNAPAVRNSPSVQYSSDDEFTEPRSRASELRDELPPPDATYAIDQLGAAEAAGDVGRMARIALAFPDDAASAAARKTIEGKRVYRLTIDGHLADDGDRHWLSAFPYYCTEEDATAVEEIASVTFVPMAVRIRYTHDYRKGLGRAIGKRRLAPHPKTVTITVEPIPNPNGKTGRTEVQAFTPRIKDEELGTDGWSDERVWEATLAPLRSELRRALSIEGDD